MKKNSWIDSTAEVDNTVCEICNKKEVKTTRCKIPNPKGYEPVLNVCDACMKKNNLTEYDGSDWASDWN